MDFSIYKLVMHHLNKTCLISHYLHPSHNLASVETLRHITKDLNHPDEFTILNEGKQEFLAEFPCFKPFDCKIQVCCPLYAGSNQVDVATNTVKRKLKWERKLKMIKIPYIDRAIEIIKDLQKNRNPCVPKTLKKYLQHIRNDPEPCFSGSYNWMFSGGNLDVVNIKDDILVLGADMENAFPYFNVFKYDPENSSLEIQHTLQCKKNSPILQLQSKSKENRCLIAVRQKNMMTFFAMTLTKQGYAVDLLWKKVIAAPKFFTSLDMGDDCEKIVTSDTTGDVHLYDVNSKMKDLIFASEISEKDNWKQLIFDKKMVYMTNREYLNILDTRLDQFSNPVFKYSPSEAVHFCEDICSITRSSLDSNYLYLGTYHHLIHVDIRKNQAVQRWTHQMRNPPQFLLSVEQDGRDLILLQSNQSSEIVGIINGYANDDKDNIYFHSSSLPRAFTNLNSYLRAARMKGLCLNPRMEKRFLYSVTGIQCFKTKHKADVQLLTINSGGDIFLSEITKAREGQGDSPLEYADFIQRTKEYERRLEKIWSSREAKLRLRVEDMKGIKNDLSRRHVRHKKSEGIINWRLSQMYERESLMLYRDVMAQKILKVWDMDRDEPEVSTSFSAMEKVQEWMNAI